jgi:hypothetical protein
MLPAVARAARCNRIISSCLASRRFQLTSEIQCRVPYPMRPPGGPRGRGACVPAREDDPASLRQRGDVLELLRRAQGMGADRSPLHAIACTYSFMNRSLDRYTMRAFGRLASCWWPIECSRWHDARRAGCLPRSRADRAGCEREGHPGSARAAGECARLRRVQCAELRSVRSVVSAPPTRIRAVLTPVIPCSEQVGKTLHCGLRAGWRLCASRAARSPSSRSNAWIQSSAPWHGSDVLRPRSRYTDVSWFLPVGAHRFAPRIGHAASTWPVVRPGSAPCRSAHEPGHDHIVVLPFPEKIRKGAIARGS